MPTLTFPGSESHQTKNSELNFSMYKMISGRTGQRKGNLFGLKPWLLFSYV